MLIDTHAHLSGDELSLKAPQLIERATQAGVSHIVNICTDLSSLHRGVELQKEGLPLSNVAATTPHDVEKDGEAHFIPFAKAAREGLLVAVGETGLDYYYEHANRRVQQEFLERYLMLAQETNLPVVIHCREAFDDLFAIIDNAYPQGGSAGRILLHCFTGNQEEALRVVERGWLLSLSGILTFKRSLELRETVRKLPLSSLVVETDAPYLAPQSRRGKQNEPAFVQETAQVLADVLGLSFEEVARETTHNATTFFCL